MTTTTTRVRTCRYLKRDGNRCTGETADEFGEIELCVHHLALAWELIEQRRKQMLQQ